MGRRGIAIAVLAFSSFVNGQEPIRVGMVNDLTGTLADAGVQLDNGVKTALRSCGRTIHVIRRDTGGPAPQLARRLAHDLVARDKVHVLAGFILTENAAAAAEVSAQAKVVVVVMHAPGAGVLEKSPYAVRTSHADPFVGGYDGMYAICEALRRTGGRSDADALITAMKGMRWESPRGPVFIAAESRELVAAR
ncbi:MAG TPA: ABC transporter substrate-binding protein [Burkholderiales bacterium]|nr:ABC transporter substrate-binding protein [Burkholderiales bacterium]